MCSADGDAGGSRHAARIKQALVPGVEGLRAAGTVCFHSICVQLRHTSYLLLQPRSLRRMDH